MRSSRSSSSGDLFAENVASDQAIEQSQDKPQGNYQWVALSVTTVGALLASMQGSALLIALPDIMAELHASFFTIMLV